MSKIAVIGDRASVYGFAALGLDTRFAPAAEDAKKLLRQLAGEDYSVIYITEQLADQLKDELARLNEAPLPAVIPIPGVFGNTGMGMRAVNESVIRAVGSDIV